MKNKSPVQGFVVILIALTVSGCGGYAAIGVESDAPSLPLGKLRAAPSASAGNQNRIRNGIWKIRE